MLKYALTSRSDARRIDIGFDVYSETSIKNAEKGHCQVGTLHFKNIIKTQYIKQWGCFLSSGENKTELIRYLVSRKKSDCSVNEKEDTDVFLIWIAASNQINSNLFHFHFTFISILHHFSFKSKRSSSNEVSA